MSINVKFNVADFNAELRRYAKVRQEPLNAEMCNQKAYWVAINSVKSTKAADRGKIELALGQIAAKAYYIPKSGKNKGKAIPLKRPKKVFAEQDTLAHRIVLRDWIDTHGEGTPMPLDLQKQAVAELRASRLKGINFVKAGFAQIAQKFSKTRWDGKRAKTFGVRSIGRKGMIRAATPGAKAMATMTHQGLYPRSKNSRRTGNPYRYAESGLYMGFQKEIASMQRYITEKMEKAWAVFPWKR